MTLDDRIAAALTLRRQTYNCAQCVSMVFYPEMEIVSAGLGRGVAGTGHICGAALAMALVESQRSYTGPADKQQLFARIKQQLEQFAALNSGLTNCSDLRQPGRKPCEQLIADAISIIHNSLS